MRCAQPEAQPQHSVYSDGSAMVYPSAKPGHLSTDQFGKDRAFILNPCVVPRPGAAVRRSRALCVVFQSAGRSSPAPAGLSSLARSPATFVPANTHLFSQLCATFLSRIIPLPRRFSCPGNAGTILIVSVRIMWEAVCSTEWQHGGYSLRGVLAPRFLFSKGFPAEAVRACRGNPVRGVGAVISGAVAMLCKGNS